jgi:hypothetical protein
MKTEPFFKLTIISALTFILSMVTHAATDKPAADKPNVVFILCDDLGYGDLTPAQQSVPPPAAY